MLAAVLNKLRTGWIGWNAAYSTAVAILTVELTVYSGIARFCTLLVLWGTAWCTGVSWLGGRADLTTLGWGPPMVPYAMISFGLVSLMLVASTFHVNRIPVFFSQGVKFGLSVVLLSAATMAITDLVFNTSSILALQLPMDDPHRSTPSTMAIVGFVLLSILGQLDHDSRWRYIGGGVLVGIGGIAVVGVFAHYPICSYNIPGFSVGMAWSTAVLLMLSGMCYILMTKHWQLIAKKNQPPRCSR